MQTKRQSLIETSVSIGVGFLLAMATQCVVARLWNFPLRLHDNFAITVIFTVVSFARQYVLRRIFNRLHARAD